jgi:hypothetical protein
MNPKTAQTIASVIMLAFMLVGGYYVRVSVGAKGSRGCLGTLFGGVQCWTGPQIHLSP